MKVRTILVAALGGVSMGLIVPGTGWPNALAVVAFSVLLSLLMEPALRLGLMSLYWRVRYRRAYNAPLVVDEDGTLHTPLLLPWESLHAHEHPDGSTCVAVLDRNGLPRKTLHLPA